MDIGLANSQIKLRHHKKEAKEQNISPKMGQTMKLGTAKEAAEIPPKMHLSLPPSLPSSANLEQSHVARL